MDTRTGNTHRFASQQARLPYKLGTRYTAAPVEDSKEVAMVKSRTPEVATLYRSPLGILGTGLAQKASRCAGLYTDEQVHWLHYILFESKGRTRRVL